MRTASWTLAALVAVAPTAAARGFVAGAPQCPVFPADNPWNIRVDALPVAPDSDELVAAIGRDRPLHPDFSAVGDGIPINVVGRRTVRQRIRSWTYGAESDRVAYPIPSRPKIERGSDRHVVMLDRDSCRLFELFDARRAGRGWRAGSGAVFDLRRNAVRPAGWTSADAAGLPILPGLVRFEEVARGEIAHAVRFTAPRTAQRYLFPARHAAGTADPGLPPMGLRVRLKASVSIERFGPQPRVILTALKRYGMILADNGSPWFITGAPHPRWNDDALHALRELTGADFEVVDPSALPTG